MDPTTESEFRPREAILLVAGMGRRLRPLTRDCPKCLLDVGGTPLLVRLLRQLEQVGIERVILATGHLHRSVVERVEGESFALDIEAIANEAYRHSNNAVSLAVAMDALSTRRFLLCDGDILVRRAQLLGQLLDVPRDNVLAMMRFETLGAEEMKIAVDPEHNRIRKLGKSLSPNGADGESLGIQKVGPSALSQLRARLSKLDETQRENLYYEDIFAELISRNVEFYACDLPPRGWTEIDTVDDLERAREMVAQWDRKERTAKGAKKREEGTAKGAKKREEGTAKGAKKREEGTAKGAKKREGTGKA